MTVPAQNYYDIRLVHNGTGEVLEQYGCYGKSATIARRNFLRRARYNGIIVAGDNYTVEVYVHDGKRHEGWGSSPSIIYRAIVR